MDSPDRLVTPLPAYIREQIEALALPGSDLVNAGCHRGLVSIDKCTQCARVLRFRRLITEDDILRAADSQMMRVVRVVTYVGPRAWIDAQLRRSITGTIRPETYGSAASITAVTIEGPTPIEGVELPHE